MKDKVLFGIVALVATAALLWMWPRLVIAVRGQAYAGAGVLMPILALIVAARGVGWKRKAVFLGIGFLGYGLLDAYFGLSGMRDLAARTAQGDAGVAVASVLYHTFRFSFPFAVLIACVRGRPEVLWERSPSSAGEAPSE